MKYIFAAIIIISACMGEGLFAETIQIPPSKDNTLYFSQTGNLSNGSGAYFFVGNTASNFERRAVIAFDIAGNIPAGATITSAQLTLNMTRSTSGPQSIALQRMLSDWGEGTSNAGGQEGGGGTTSTGDATWIHRFSPDVFWNNAGGDFSMTQSASLTVGVPGVYSWGSTVTMVSDIQMWLETPASNFGWILTGPGTSGTAKRFNSREHQTIASRPVLQINYDLPVAINSLIYPHVASDGTWETEIAVINAGSTQVSGKMAAYGNNGQKTGEEIAILLDGKGRREIIIGNEFMNPGEIGYVIFESNSNEVVGYTKFFIEGQYRVAVPAVDTVNSGDLIVSHIASSMQWWTGISLINTTDSAKAIILNCDNGAVRQIQFAPGEHRAFTIRSLFGGNAQPDIGACTISNTAGFVGLELFGSMNLAVEKYLSGILLKDNTTLTMYYPHVASDAIWWTGLVAYNPSNTAAELIVTTYTADGIELTAEMIPLGGGEKFIGTASSLDLPSETAWFRLDSTIPVTGFELFGTQNGNQLAGYTGVDISGKTGIFAKKGSDGWTGIALVNIESSDAMVTLTAYDDGGTIVTSQLIPLDSFEKLVDLAENFFSGDISEATYITYMSDRTLVGFQLNGSPDDMLLDGLPGLMVSGAQ